MSQDFYDFTWDYLFFHAKELWEERGRKQLPALCDPLFGESGYDETKLAIRVDCVEGDEQQMERESENIRSAAFYLYP